MPIHMCINLHVLFIIIYDSWLVLILIIYVDFSFTLVLGSCGEVDALQMVCC